MLTEKLLHPFLGSFMASSQQPQVHDCCYSACNHLRATGTQDIKSQFPQTLSKPDHHMSSASSPSTSCFTPFFKIIQNWSRVSWHMPFCFFLLWVKTVPVNKWNVVLLWLIYFFEHDIATLAHKWHTSLQTKSLG